MVSKYKVLILSFLFMSPYTGPIFGQNPHKIIRNDLRHVKAESMSSAFSVLPILAASEHDENMLLFKVKDFAIHKDGRIFILEGGTKKIQVYSSEGVHLNTMSGPGEGPSELKSPKALYLFNNTLFVIDPLLKKVIHFSLDGTYLSSFKTKYRPQDIVVTSKGECILLQPNHVQPEKLFKYNSSGKFVSAFGSIPKRRNLFESTRIAQGSLAIDSNDNVYATVAQPYQIEKYNSQNDFVEIIQNEIQSKIIEPHSKVERTAKYVNEQINFYSRLSVDLRVRDDKIFYLYSANTGFLLSGDIIDVFSLEGTFIERFTLDKSATKIAVSREGAIFCFFRSFEMPKGIPIAKKNKYAGIPQLIKFVRKSN